MSMVKVYTYIIQMHDNFRIILGARLWTARGCENLAGNLSRSGKQQLLTKWTKGTSLLVLLIG